MAQDYNSTINLPKTDFEMRAGLPKKEPKLLKDWKENSLYFNLMKHNEGKPRFVLHDGPPYANGNIHMGTALNKIIKDIIVRYKNMTGFQAPYVPGYDTHGLPIELKALAAAGDKKKDISKLELRKLCHNFATEHIGVMGDQFQRLGVIGDFDNPYLTLKPEFEARQIEIFGEMAKRGFIYKGMKPVYWCPDCQTALAEAEIEYGQDECDSIFVRFQINGDPNGVLAKAGIPADKAWIVIWTTTTWTLPANVAVSVHPDFEYSFVKIGEDYHIMATDLVKSAMEACGIADYEIVGEPVRGSELEMMTYQHPFLDRTGLVIVGTHVTLESGTGCVHTAPAHGVDDFIVCQKYPQIPVEVPVNDKGILTSLAGKYEGLMVWKANPIILADIKASGHLMGVEHIEHQYPHCWRCHKPIIFRATSQWFCSIDAFKEDVYKAIETVNWQPAWGHDRMTGMVRDRADWCISRQRRWGLPIPVFYCADCGKPVCTDETIEAVSALFAEKGSNAWFEMDAADILPKGFACPHCGKSAGFTKEEDTLDGWFDSGSTHFAAMKKDQGFWPATMYLEGLDQYRGWFQSSLLTAVGAFGEGAPFKECVTHGWTVDGEGRAMHKSLGNGVDPADIFNENGADILRLWAASADYHADVRCSKAIFQQLSQNYLKFRNTCKFMLDNLVDFDPAHLTKAEDMPVLDRWLITKLNELIEKVEQSYNDYEFHIITHAVNDFCVTTLSSFYLDIVKDRLYCEAADSAERRSAQTALYLTLSTLAKLFAPILAFTCDEIWLAMPHTAEDDARNVVLNDMNKPFTAYALDAETMARWEHIIEVRTAVNGALEEARAAKVIGKSLEADVHLTVPEGDVFLADENPAALADLFIVSKVELTVGRELAVKVENAAGTKCPRCWKHSLTPNAEGLCPRCAEVVRHLPDLL